jgi:hypothetical protein
MASRGRLLHRVVLTIELVADRRPNEVGAVGVKPLLDQEIDVTEVDKAKIDCDLFAVRHFRAKLVNLFRHIAIPLPSVRMVNGHGPPASQGGRLVIIVAVD